MKHETILIIIGIVVAIMLAKNLDLFAVLSGEEDFVQLTHLDNVLPWRCDESRGQAGGDAICDNDQFSCVVNIGNELRSTLTTGDGYLRINNQRGGAWGSHCFLKKDVYGTNLRMRVDVPKNYGLSISVNTQYGATTFSIPKTGDVYLLEMISSDLNPNEIAFFLNGIRIKDITLDGEMKVFDYPHISGKLIIGFNTNTAAGISDIKQKIPFSCAIPENHLLAMETFSGGQNIDIYSTRYPVRSFCLEQPVIRTSADKKGGDTTAEPYLRLIKGESLAIPKDQTWTLFYVFDNGDNKVLTPCKANQAYYVNGQSCRDEIGIVQVCSEGVFSPDLGLCVITAQTTTRVNTTFVCDKGRLVLEQNKTLCVYNPPFEQLCKEGTFNTVTGTCQSPVLFDCPSGTNKKLVNEQTVCYAELPKTIPVQQDLLVTKAPIVTEAPKQLNTIIPIGIAVAALIAFLLLSRRK